MHVPYTPYLVSYICMHVENRNRQQHNKHAHILKNKLDGTETCTGLYGSACKHVQLYYSNGRGGYIQMGFQSKVTYQEDGKTPASNKVRFMFHLLNVKLITVSHHL